MPLPTNRFRRAALALTAFALTAAPALAQRDLQPPTAEPGDAGAPVVQMLIAFVLLAIVIGVNLIPAKRGHQD